MSSRLSVAMAALAVPVSVTTLLVLLLAPTAGLGYWSRDFAPMGVYATPGAAEVTSMTEWNGYMVVSGYIEQAGHVDADWIAAWNGSYWSTFDGGLTASSEPNFIFPYGSSLLVGGHRTDGISKWDGNQWLVMEREGGLGGEALCCCTHNGVIYIDGTFITGFTTPWYTPMLFWDIDIDDWNYVSIAGWRYEHDDAYSIHPYYGRIYIGGWFMNEVIADPDVTYNIMGWSSEEGDVAFGEGVDGAVYKVVSGTAGVWLAGGFAECDGTTSKGLVFMGTGGTFGACELPDVDRECLDMIKHGDTKYLIERTGDYPYDYKVRSYTSGSGWGTPLGGVFDDPLVCLADDPADIYVGGSVRNGVVRWDDDQWVHLGGGIGTRNQGNYYIRALQAWNGGIVAGGNFDLPRILRDVGICESVAFWDGDAWHRMGNNGVGSVTVSDIGVYDDELYLGTESAGVAGRFSRWDTDAEEWEQVADVNGQMRALCVHDDKLILGGTFTQIDGQAIDRIAAWDGANFTPLGSGCDNTVAELFSDGHYLYAAGNFTTAGGVPANRIARWDGVNWEALGDGFDAYVYALTMYEGEIIAGGNFTHSGAAEINRVARYDGAAWQPLGDGLTSGETMYYGVTALRGTTTDLYVGGEFDTAGGIPASGLAVWNGAVWDEFEGGVHEEGTSVRVYDLEVVEGDLWVAGDFLEAGTRSSCNIARWVDGSIQSTLLESFQLEPGGSAVSVSWVLSADVGVDDLRLRANTDNREWDVSIVLDGRTFSARDESPWLRGVEQVTYTLSYRQPEGWDVLFSELVALTPPQAMRLYEAVPNPFNPTTQLDFELPHRQHARLEVYDLTGRRVAVLADGVFEPGRLSRVWNGRDGAGREVPSGTYLVRLSTEGGVRAQKVLLVR